MLMLWYKAAQVILKTTDTRSNTAADKSHDEDNESVAILVCWGAHPRPRNKYEKSSFRKNEYDNLFDSKN